MATSPPDLPDLRLRILLGERVMVGPGKAELLDRIRDCGSISAAGRAMGMSYKRAWSLVDEMNGGFAEPLVVSARGGPGGGGASLTATGVAVLALRALRTPGTRWLGRLLMAGLVFKLGLEAGWANPVGFNDAWGFNVVYAAHLTGAAAGLATALVLGWLPSASRRNS